MTIDDPINEMKFKAVDSAQSDESYRELAIDARDALYEAACQLDDAAELINHFELESLACLLDSIQVLRDSEGRFYDAFMGCDIVKALLQEEEVANG